MYSPNQFIITDFAQVKDFIQQNPLATVVATQDGKTEICHVPLLWQPNFGKKDGQNDGKNAHGELGYLIGHVAKNNPIVNFDKTDWQVIVNDNGHYISPNWYPSKAQTHKEVPTWNYQAVLITATPTLYMDSKSLQQIIGTMTDSFERTFTEPSHQPWSLADAPQDYIEAMCRAIVGFKLTITSFEAKFKLSQNKSAENVKGVIAGLREVDTVNANDMAELVKTFNMD